MDRQKAKQIIGNLFRHSESAFKIGSMQEAETFAAKAKELMDKFNIEQTELDNQDKSNVDDSGLFGIDYRVFNTLYSNNTPDWFLAFCDATVRICTVKILQLGFGTDCRIFANTADQAEAAMDMLDSLLKLSLKLFNRLQKEQKDLVRKDYLLGFAKACIDGAIKEEQDKAKANAEKFKQALAIISNALTAKVESLLKLGNEEKKLEAESATDNTRFVDSKSIAEGYHDGKTRQNTRIEV